MSMLSQTSAPAGVARTAVAASVTACLAVVWAHALALPLRGLTAADPALWALPLTLAALGVATATSLRSREHADWRAAGASAVLAWLMLRVMDPAGSAPALALLPIALASAAVMPRLVQRLPPWLDLEPARHRLRSALWLLSALLAIVQVARLATWMSDPSSDWFVSTRHPFWAKHECLSAYLYGGELGLRDAPNIYDAAHYPGLNPAAKPSTEVAQMTVEDPFQYAPQFLLWPAAVLTVSHDYPSIRAAWFALQTTLLLGAAVWLALWVGGRAGRISLALWPLALTAFPVLYDLQYGQFHLAAVMLAVGAMLAFAAGRERTGGALLAVATLSKIFPGILLLVLLARRDWRALAWTFGFGAALTLATLLVFGSAPFAAFAGYHLPRLQSGAAFAFGEAWPEIRDMIIVSNQGIYGVVVKLAEMDVPGASQDAAVWLNRLYGIALAGLAWVVGRRLEPGDREQQAIAWLALVGLSSLLSTGAFADYVPATAIWLLTLLGARVRTPGAVFALLVIGLLQYTLFGTMPLGTWFDPRVMLPLSALSALTLFGLFGWTLWLALRQPRPATANQPAWPGASRVVG